MKNSGMLTKQHKITTTADLSATRGESEKVMNMNELNKIWKEHTGKDLTEKEAWGMVEFVKMVMEHADKNLDKVLKENE